MISNNLAKNAIAIALQLEKLGVNIIPGDNTPMSELHEAAVPCAFTKKGEVEVDLLPGGKVVNRNVSTWTTTSSDDLAAAIAMATCNSTEVSTHTLRITSLADDLAPLVTSHLYTTRNVVRPLIESFESAAVKFLELAHQRNPASDFSIKVHRIPAILADESFNALGLDMIMKTDELKESSPRLTVKIDDIDQAVSEIINLGSERMNGLIGEWLRFAPANLIKNTLLVNFTNMTNYEETGAFVFSSYDLRRGNQAKAMDVSLAMWLICYWLKNNVKQTVNSVSLTEYDKIVSYWLESAGIVLKASLVMMANQISGDVMVLNISPTTKEIVVHENLYRKYLEKGGKADALLGMIVSNNTFYNTDLILSNQEKLITSWVNYVQYRTATILTDTRDGFKGWVRSYMQIALSELTDIEKEYQGENSGHVERVMKNVDAEIERLGHRLHEDIPHTALHLVAAARFYFTSAYTILSEMQQIARANPEIDPREAATAAVIGYLVEYQASQFDFVALKPRQ